VFHHAVSKPASEAPEYDSDSRMLGVTTHSAIRSPLQLISIPAYVFNLRCATFMVSVREIKAISK
jgi:hypothetical protein